MSRSGFAVAAGFSIAASLTAWGTLQVGNLIDVDAAQAAFVLFLGVLGLGVVFTSVRFARSGLRDGLACGLGAATGLTVSMLVYWAIGGPFGGDSPMPRAGALAVLVLAGPYIAWMLALTGAYGLFSRFRGRARSGHGRDARPLRPA